MTLRRVDAPVVGSITVMYVLIGPGSLPNEYRADEDQAMTVPSRRLAIAAGTSGTSTGSSMVDIRDCGRGPQDWQNGPGGLMAKGFQRVAYRKGQPESRNMFLKSRVLDSLDPQAHRSALKDDACWNIELGVATLVTFHGLYWISLD